MEAEGHQKVVGRMACVATSKSILCQLALRMDEEQGIPHGTALFKQNLGLPVVPFYPFLGRVPLLE